MWEACKGDGESLKGVSGSAGTVEGKVCVITSPAEFYKLKKGDILVCHYIDPEWTPLFAIAGGVIADTGGVLSHAAIVVSLIRASRDCVVLVLHNHPSLSAFSLSDIQFLLRYETVKLMVVVTNLGMYHIW